MRSKWILMLIVIGVSMISLIGWTIYFGQITGNAIDSEGFVYAYKINIESNAFSIPSAHISTGESILWENIDNKIHAIDSVGDEWNSALLSQGERYSHKFSSPGVYSYYCKVHPNVIGQIIVN